MRTQSAFVSAPMVAAAAAAQDRPQVRSLTITVLSTMLTEDSERGIGE